MPRLLGFFATLAFLVSSCEFAEASAFALIADLENGTIYKGSLERRLADLSPLPLSGLMRPVAVDYDPVEGMVYWTDQRSDNITPKICRALLDGGNQTIVVNDLHEPTGMALDITNRMVYWTDAALAFIRRARMDGTGSKETFFNEEHYSPRGIIVDRVHGHVFWSDVGDNPQIERADVDGSNRMIVVEGGLSWPSSVTIDVAGDSLYWIDALQDIVETSDTSGNNRRVVANLTLYSLSFPFDLAVYGDHVYWTGWSLAPSLLRVHLDGRDGESFGPAVFQMPGGVHIEEVEADTTPPVVSGCPAGGVAATADAGTSSAAVTWTPPVATDGPGTTVTSSSNYSPGHVFGLGTTTVRYTFADVAGNQAVCSFVVSVAGDETYPLIACPPDVVRYVRSSSQQVTVSWSSPTATDDSGVQPTVTSRPSFPSPTGSFGVGVHVVTYTAQNAALNTASCSVTINIIWDYIFPTVTGCPDDSSIVLPPGSGSVVVRWAEPQSADDNGWVNTTRSHRPGDRFTQGATPVTYTVADRAGNVAVCSFVVTVVAGCVVSPTDHLQVVSGLKPAYLPGESVQFSCPAGYQLGGSASRICLADLTWSGEPAICQPEAMTCKAPPTSNHVTSDEAPGHAFQPGDVAGFRCREHNFVVTGTNTRYAERVCQSDGSWSSEPVECSPDNGANDTSVGEALGGTAAGGLLLIVIVLIALLFVRRRRKRNAQRTVRAQDIVLMTPPINTYNDTHAYETPAALYETSILGAAAAADTKCAAEMEAKVKEVRLPPDVPQPPPPLGPPPSYEYASGPRASDRPPTYMELE